MRLLLVRHGQTSSNLQNLLDTMHPGPGLTELGIEQAAAIPAALATEDIGAIYASTLTRAELTAAPLAEERGLPIQIRDGIREVTAGDLEMLGDRHSIRVYLTTVMAWSDGEVALRMPGGESGEEALGRFDDVVAEAASGGHDAVVLVSHGAAIRMWTAARAKNIDVEFASSHPLSNTGIVVLEGDLQDGWNAVSWTGMAIGGPELADPDTDGPAADLVAR
jgi:broad specificity phosphatase PhoE